MSYLPPIQNPELRQASKVAWMYTYENKKQTEIAEELSISQSKVSRLLRLAHTSGIIHVSVIPPTGVYTELENNIEKLYGLRECIVTETRESEEALANDIGAAASAYIQSTLSRKEIIGVSSWSNTWLQAIARLGRFKEPSAAYVVQLIGGMGDPRVQAQANQLLSTLSSATGAEPIFLQAPAIVQNKSVKESLIHDPVTGHAVNAWEKTTVALLGIGSVEPSPLLRETGIVNESLTKEMTRKGAVGDVCLHYFDKEGAPINSSITERIVGISAKQLMRIPRRIGAAGGERKHKAILAALKGKWINTLITDTETANFLLKESK